MALYSRSFGRRHGLPEGLFLLIHIMTDSSAGQTAYCRPDSRTLKSCLGVMAYGLTYNCSRCSTSCGTVNPAFLGPGLWSGTGRQHHQNQSANSPKTYVHDNTS
jgi:hypothetical protein